VIIFTDGTKFNHGYSSWLKVKFAMSQRRRLMGDPDLR
jgi:hypothetical protein